MAWHDVTECVQAGAGFLTVLLAWRALVVSKEALIAGKDAATAAGDAALAARDGLVTARHAAQAAKDTISLPRMLAALGDVLAKAREVREAYDALFVAYPAREAKVAARTRFIELREFVGVLLDDARIVHPELGPALEAWRDLEDEDEHPHASGDDPHACDAATARAATTKFDRAHRRFRDAVSALVAQLRKNERTPA
jgi:hypothetical protein